MWRINVPAMITWSCEYIKNTVLCEADGVCAGINVQAGKWDMQDQSKGQSESNKKML